MPGFVPVVYSDGTPVMRTGGKIQREACVHLAAWLVWYDRLQVARGRGHVVYYQTQGVDTTASKGTHDCGSAWDMKWISDASIADAREMGAASWHRVPGYNGWPSNGADHVHSLIMCGDNGCNGYQYVAYWLGYNGLGLNGVGAGDPLPKPSMRRNWQEGIAWAQAQIGTPIATTTTEDDMPRLLISQDGTGWLATDRGITPVDMLEAQAIHRVLTATEYDPGSTTVDKIDPAQLTRYATACARLNSPAAPTTSTTVTVNVDDAAAARIATAVWAPIRKV
jgi:hypothetical protein